jgi:hypothetical protein
MGSGFCSYRIGSKTAMTCVAADQRKAASKIYPVINKLFNENGVEFARPVVKMAASCKVTEAAAARMVAATKTCNARAAN